MHILLTGGTGLIGRALCAHWAGAGHRLTVWSRQPERVPALCAGAQGVAHLTDIGMLFVRCKGGVSHSPDESVDIGDVRIAAEALFLFVSKFRAV